jgi:hypothetical protein
MMTTDRSPKKKRVSYQTPLKGSETGNDSRTQPSRVSSVIKVPRMQIIQQQMMQQNTNNIVLQPI